MGWDYKREESNGFDSRIPEGKHRVRIKAAEKAVSSKGKDMLVLQLTVSGYNETVYHYITFLPDNPQLTNRNLTQLFDSFQLPAPVDGNFNMGAWIGKVGACTIKHEEYNGNTKSKVGYFIHADKQTDLPAWVEPSGSTGGGNTVPTDADGFMKVDDTTDMPF